MTDIRALIDGLRREIAAAPVGAARVQESCRQAEEANAAGRRWPKWMRPLFRNQSRINRLLVWSVRTLLHSHTQEAEIQQRRLDRLQKEIEQLKEQVKSLSSAR